MPAATTIRGVHLCGSLVLLNDLKAGTADDAAAAEQVMREMTQAHPQRLTRLPDGELGKRDYFIKWQTQVFVKTPWICSHEALAMFGVSAPAMPPSDDDNDIILGDLEYDTYAIQNYQAFAKLKKEGVIDQHTRFQVCLPSPINSVGLFVEQKYKARVEPVYEAAMLKVVRNIQDHIPHRDLAIQWDCPTEIAYLEGIDGIAPFHATWFDASLKTIMPRIERICAAVDPDVQLGFHLCYGDAGHQHFMQPKDTQVLVNLANAMCSALSRSVDFIHMPVPVDRKDDAYFAPLRGLHLHPETELYLGVVHPHDLSGTRERIAAAQRAFRRFGVATECGIGRWTREEAQSIVDIQREVSDAV